MPYPLFQNHLPFLFEKQNLMIHVLLAFFVPLYLEIEKIANLCAHFRCISKRIRLVSILLKNSRN